MKGSFSSGIWDVPSVQSKQEVSVSDGAVSEVWLRRPSHNCKTFCVSHAVWSEIIINKPMLVQSGLCWLLGLGTETRYQYGTGTYGTGMY